MIIRDHGEWVRYVPKVLPNDAPENAMFCKRSTDCVDWYDYVNRERDAISAGSVMFAADWREDVGQYIVGAATYDVTQLFPAGFIVREIIDYTGSDPQKDFGGKAYDPETDTFSDPPLAPPAPSTQVLFDHENRLRTIEGEPPLAMDGFLKKMRG